MIERIWCPVDALSKHSICPQNSDDCPHYQLLFTEYESETEYVEVYHCELVTASMLLNRCKGIISAKSWCPKFPNYKEMRRYLYQKYFKHLKIPEE